MSLPTPRTLTNVLSSFAVMFRAVTLGAVQFLPHSLPSPEVVHMTPAATGYGLLFAILIPTLALTVLDRALAWRDPRRVRAFRIAVFAVSGTLVIRQLQLYFAPVRVFAEPVESVPVLPAVVFIACATAWVAACCRWPDNIRQYFVYASPVAVVLLLYAAGVMPANTSLPVNYTDAVPSSGDKERPAVVVLALDEWAFSLVAGDDGMVDHERYPHLASLAGDGVWFTNATTNHSHTRFVIPPLAEAAADLSPEYDLTIYDQFAFVEQLLSGGCGTEYTCRGTHLLATNEAFLVRQLLLRARWEAFPSALEPSLAKAAALMGHDHAYPHTDPYGIHTFTPELYEMFLEDLDAETAYGRVHFFHPLLPHRPFVYEEDGSLRTARPAPSYPDANPEDTWEKYSEQMVYTDKLLGILFDELKREGIYDDSIIIVTGDHGLRREDDPNISAPVPVDDVVARVPLVIKAPGLKPGVSDVDYQHTDFAATLFDITGIPAPAGTEGVSAFAEERPVREKVFYTSARDFSRYWEYRLSGGQWTSVAEHLGAFPGAHGDAALHSHESGPLPPAQE